MAETPDLRAWLRARILELQPTAAGRLDGDPDLLSRGLLDSMQFVELLGIIHRDLGLVVDFGAIDDFERVTRLEGLASYLAELRDAGA